MQFCYYGDNLNSVFLLWERYRHNKKENRSVWSFSVSTWTCIIIIWFISFNLVVGRVIVSRFQSWPYAIYFNFDCGCPRIEFGIVDCPWPFQPWWIPVKGKIRMPWHTTDHTISLVYHKVANEIPLPVSYPLLMVSKWTNNVLLIFTYIEYENLQQTSKIQPTLELVTLITGPPLITDVVLFWVNYYFCKKKGNIII